MRKLFLFGLIITAFAMVGCGGTDCKELCKKVNECRQAKGDNPLDNCTHSCEEIEVDVPTQSVQDCIIEHSCANLDTGDHCGGNKGDKLPKN